MDKLTNRQCSMTMIKWALTMKVGRFLLISVFALLFVLLLLFRGVAISPRQALPARVPASVPAEEGRGLSVSSSKIEVTPRPRTTVNYSILATEGPRTWTLGTDNATYSRLGVQLKLNYAERCPRGSLMLDSQWRHFVPEHLDCPTLFIVGARKGGTTSLYTYVSRHPDFEGILLDRGPQAGETFYFSTNYEKEGWGGWNRYIKMFEQVNWYMTGDSSVGNLVNCEVPKRVWQSCGKQAKIIMLLRDPLKRFESNYLMRVNLSAGRYNNNTKASTVVEVQLQRFITATLKKRLDMKRVDKLWEKFRCLFSPTRSLIFEGIYYIHVMNWLCNFPPENILILNSEEFYNNTPKIFEQVLQFLGLPSLDHDTRTFITSVAYNQGRGVRLAHQHMSELDRKKLMAIYKYSNQPLFELLDWRNVGWS